MISLIRKTAIALAAAMALSTGQAAASDPTCLATDHSAAGGLNWYLGIHPSDDLLSVWCRLQDIPGAVRFNVMFPTTGAHRSWDTTFDGPTLPAARIVELIQSLLPTGDGPARDQNGMEFPKVLQNVVQLSAARAPDRTPLAFATAHPASRTLVLWEPLLLRVRPIALAGQEFTLTVVMRPNLGLLSLALDGKATDVRFRGWRGRMQLAGGLFGGSCSSAIPQCEGIEEAPLFHAPWIVEEVRLEATGENMTEAAAAIMNQFIHSSRNSRFIRDGSRPTFRPETGHGSLVLSDGMTSMRMSAEGSRSGTREIKIVWKEETNSEGIAKRLQAIAETYRSGKEGGQKAPSVPDSLGNL